MLKTAEQIADDVLEKIGGDPFNAPSIKPGASLKPTGPSIKPGASLKPTGPATTSSLTGGIDALNAAKKKYRAAGGTPNAGGMNTRSTTRDGTTTTRQVVYDTKQP